MSRTDKDAPDWATATWWEPLHNIGCPHYPVRSWQRGARHRECDLPARPVRHRDNWQRGQGCVWVHVSERHRWHYAPPAWFINHAWNAPDRLRARTECRAAASEYRASGEVDTVPTTTQHRHGATWLWD